MPSALQMSIEQLGYIAPAPLPMNVTGQMDLTQAMTGPVDNGTAATRGYVVTPSGMPYFSNASQVIHQSNRTTYPSYVQRCSRSISICQWHFISAVTQRQISKLSSCSSRLSPSRLSPAQRLSMLQLWHARGALDIDSFQLLYEPWLCHRPGACTIILDLLKGHIGIVVFVSCEVICVHDPSLLLMQVSVATPMMMGKSSSSPMMMSPPVAAGGRRL